MASLIPPEYFVYLGEAYFRGWYVPIDLFFYILFFGSMSKVALKDKFGKVMPYAFASVFAFSLVLVEVGSGINLFQFSWIPILVGSFALWFWLYSFFANALKIPENNLTDEQEKYKFWILLWTGIVALCVCLSFFAAFGQLALQGRAASLHMAWSVDPVAKSISMLESVLGFLVGFVLVGLLFSLVGIISGHGPLAPPSHSVSQVNEETSKTLEKLREDLDELKNETTSTFGEINAKIEELRQGSADKISKQIQEALERFKSDVFSPLDEQVQKIISSVSATGKISSDNTTQLNSLFQEVAKVKEWLEKSGQVLLAEVDKLKEKTREIESLKNSIPKEAVLRTDLERLESDLKNQLQLYQRLFETEAKLSKQQVINETNNELAKVKTDLAVMKSSLDSAQSHKDELAIVLEKISSIIKDMNASSKIVASINVEDARKIVAEEIVKVTSAIEGLGKGLQAMASARSPKIIIGGQYLEKGHNIFSPMNSAMHALDDLAEKAKQVISLLKTAGVDEEIIELIEESMKTAGTLSVSLAQAEVSGENVESLLKSEKNKQTKAAKNSAELISIVAELKNSLDSESKELSSLLSIDELIVLPVIHKIETDLEGLSETARKQKKSEVYHELGTIVQSKFLQATNRVSEAVKKIQVLLSVIEQNSSAELDPVVKELKVSAQKIVSAETSIQEYLNNFSKHFTSTIIGIVEKHLDKGKVSEKEFRKELLSSMQASGFSLTKLPEFINYLRDASAVVSGEIKAMNS